jgi:hypothetical protein
VTVLLTFELFGYVDGDQCIFERVHFGGQVSDEHSVKLDQISALIKSFLLSVGPYLISKLMPQSIE